MAAVFKAIKKDIDRNKLAKSSGGAGARVGPVRFAPCHADQVRSVLGPAFPASDQKDISALYQGYLEKRKQHYKQKGDGVIAKGQLLRMEEKLQASTGSNAPCAHDAPPAPVDGTNLPAVPACSGATRLPSGAPVTPGTVDTTAPAANSMCGLGCGASVPSLTSKGGRQETCGIAKAAPAMEACPHCKEKFARGRSLASHAAQCARNPKNKPAGAGGQSFPCPACSFPFKTSAALAQHNSESRPCVYTPAYLKTNKIRRCDVCWQGKINGKLKGGPKNGVFVKEKGWAQHLRTPAHTLLAGQRQPLRACNALLNNCQSKS